MKPLKAARQLWSKAKENSAILFRAIGLNVVVSAFKSLRHPLGRGFEEPIKIAIRKNRSVALLRALIHVLPVGIAIWEVTLNGSSYYVGSTMYRLFYYQLAAKAHEMLIQASLAAIVFSYVRHEMVLGNGIPFGALFSGLQMNQVSYLWSMEFWGVLSSSHVSFRRKAFTAVFLGVCFVLATVSGSSSAVLLIPRLDYWPAGRTHVWVNATFHDLWPDR